MTIDKQRIKKLIKLIISSTIFVLRIALAGIILWWSFGKIEEWNNFQTFREWDNHYGFEGEGTYESPYLIQNADDLIKLSDAVNNGNYFACVYFMQTNDIDMSSCNNFTPIGTQESNYMFRGIYDGNGHKLLNLTIDGSVLDSKFGGLFGRLGGVVMNLGIESGRISGDYVGSFAVVNGTDDAMIINCYNRSDLYAIHRCGGIADYFPSGSILGCANYGHLSGEITCQIVSYDCNIISGCCNYVDSNDYIVPYDTFEGRIYDCYIGTDDITELNRFIDDYQDFIIFSDDCPIDVKPWTISDIEATQ